MKLRVSYSLLNMWRRGQYEQAINGYLHLPVPSSRAMDEGIMWDQKVTEWADLYKRLPDEFGGDSLENPVTQKKIKIPYNEIVDLVILPDIVDGKTLWENKTGIKDSADYAQDFQIGMYFLGLDVEKAIINHYNQHSDTLDRTLIWKTAQETERAKNFIDTLSPEIYQYFMENGIFDKEKEIAYNTK